MKRPTFPPPATTTRNVEPPAVLKTLVEECQGAVAAT